MSYVTKHSQKDEKVKPLWPFFPACETFWIILLTMVVPVGPHNFLSTWGRAICDWLHWWEFPTKTCICLIWPSSFWFLLLQWRRTKNDIQNFRICPHLICKTNSNYLECNRHLNELNPYLLSPSPTAFFIPLLLVAHYVICINLVSFVNYHHGRRLLLSNKW